MCRLHYWRKTSAECMIPGRHKRNLNTLLFINLKHQCRVYVKYQCNDTGTHTIVIYAASDDYKVLTTAGKTIGRVENVFKLLGSIINTNSNSTTNININVRLAIAWQVTRIKQLTEKWKSAEIGLKLKNQLQSSCWCGAQR